MTDLGSSWVLLARLVRPQGRRGEVLADLFTDFPQSLTHREQLFVRPPNSLTGSPLREAAVEGHWLHKGRVVLKFVGVDSIAQAEELRGLELVTPREARLPLEGGAVYVSDLLGLMVVDATSGGDVVAGEIIAVEPEAAGPAMLVTRTPGGEELLIPFVRAYDPRIDLAAKKLRMDLPSGLLSLQAPLTDQERQEAVARESE